MNTADNMNNNPEREPMIESRGDLGRMPRILLILWIANVTFFLVYFALHAVPRLTK